jgi:hypothetical protein
LGEVKWELEILHLVAKQLQYWRTLGLLHDHI